MHSIFLFQPVYFLCILYTYSYIAYMLFIIYIIKNHAPTRYSTTNTFMFLWVCMIQKFKLIYLVLYINDNFIKLHLKSEVFKYHILTVI